MFLVYVALDNHLINQSSFSVVNVSDNGYIPNIWHLHIFGGAKVMLISVHGAIYYVKFLKVLVI